MGSRNAHRNIPAWAATLGALSAEGAELRAVCSWGTGHASVKADLARMLAAKGPLYSLWNRTFPCRVAGCAGRVKFYATRPNANVYPTMMWGALPHEAERLHADWLLEQRDRPAKAHDR